MCDWYAKYYANDMQITMIDSGSKQSAINILLVVLELL